MTDDKVAYLVYGWSPRADSMERAAPVRSWLQDNKDELLSLLGQGGIYNPEIPEPEDEVLLPKMKLLIQKVNRRDPVTGQHFEQHSPVYSPTNVDTYEQLLLQMWWLAEHNRADFVMLDQNVLPTVDDVRRLLECESEFCQFYEHRSEKRWGLAKFRWTLADRMKPSWEPSHARSLPLPGRVENWLATFGLICHPHGATRNPRTQLEPGRLWSLPSVGSRPELRP